MRKVYKTLNTNKTAPLSYLRHKCTDTNDPRHNTIVTDRREMDKMLRDAWADIRKGQAHNATKLVQHFLSNYTTHIFRDEEFQVQDITPDELMHACTSAKHTVASLDNWTTAEFALLPRSAFVLLADFLNLVEKEGRWPEQLTIAKAAFLHKDDPTNAGPLDVRPLLILPTIYRRWAGLRLHNCSDWVA